MRSMPYSALLHGNTGILLALSTRIPPIVFAGECIPDAVCAHSVNYPNYLTRKHFWQNPFPLSSVSPEEFPTWRWDFRKRKFFRTSGKVLTEAIRSKSVLANHKVQAIMQIMGNLNLSRAELATGLDFQETVYRLKKSQAQAYKKLGSAENASEFPFVEQYAEIAGISLEQAADEILFKSKIAEDKLLRSERMRLKYFDKLKKASNAEEIDAVMSEFHRENYLSALV